MTANTPGNLTRREAIGSLAAVGLATAGMTASASASAAGLNASSENPAASSSKDLGEYTLPDLPYAYNALEPAIDEQTMRIHHTKHHAGYVRGLNTAMQRLAAIRAGDEDESSLEHWLSKLSFHAGGHLNHSLFWANMAPASQATPEPTGALADAITQNFCTFAQFSKHFRDSAKKVEGSGWAWLAYEPTARRLMVLQMHNQQHNVFAGAIPLLGIDVWEHAYYLNYQNRRADYVEAFMSIINWTEVSKRFTAATI
ncbi:MAG: superoxide dismutase [Phycisphaerales bacterium]